MLPFGGQGSNQAIEDGGALGYLLNGADDLATLEQRLKIFETVRRNRASRVQTLSKVRAGKEKEIEQELRKYADGMDAGESDAHTSHFPIADVKPQYQPRSLSALLMTMGKFNYSPIPSETPGSFDWWQVRRAWEVCRSTGC